MERIKHLKIVYLLQVSKITSISNDNKQFLKLKFNNNKILAKYPIFQILTLKQQANSFHLCQ